MPGTICPEPFSPTVIVTGWTDADGDTETVTVSVLAAPPDRAVLDSTYVPGVLAAKVGRAVLRPVRRVAVFLLGTLVSRHAYFTVAAAGFFTDLRPSSRIGCWVSVRRSGPASASGRLDPTRTDRVRSCKRPSAVRARTRTVLRPKRRPALGPSRACRVPSERTVKRAVTGWPLSQAVMVAFGFTRTRTASEPLACRPLLRASPVARAVLPVFDSRTSPVTLRA